MKKATGTILIVLLVLTLGVAGTLGVILFQKNGEIDDLNSDLRRSDRTIEDYEEKIQEQTETAEKEKKELEDKNQQLKTDIDELNARLDESNGELQAQKDKIPTADSVRFDESVGRIYQQGEYGDFCSKNDTYDTLQYTFSVMYNDRTDVVFAGDSLVERCSWDELYPDLEVKNRGIGGDSINGLRVRVDTIMLTKPEKIFVYVGINDILQGREVENIIGRYNELFDVLGGTGCKIYIQSLLPVSPNQGDAERICDAVYEINSKLKNMCKDRGFTFIDMWGEFAGEDWALREEYYYDGVHVNATAYKHWKEIIDPFVYEEFE